MADTEKAAVNAWLAEHLFGLDVYELDVVYRQELGFNNRHVTAIYRADSQPWPPTNQRLVRRWVTPGGPGDYVEIPDYAGTWEGAGMVIEAMRARGWHLTLQTDLPGNECLAEYDPIGREGESVEAYDQDARVANALAAAGALGWTGGEL